MIHGHRLKIRYTLRYAELRRIENPLIFGWKCPVQKYRITEILPKNYVFFSIHDCKAN